VNLADYQRALLQLSLAEQSPPGLPGFALYRHMIRSRFVGMARQAYRRSWALLGAANMEALFARFLAHEQPRSPILRTVIADFAAFVLRTTELPARARDLLCFEAAKWRVGSAEMPSRDAREVDFDGVLVLNPTLCVLPLEHDVSEGDVAEAAHDPHTLLLYRRRGEDDVHWYRAPRLLRELLASSAGERVLAELVQALFAAHAGEPPEQLLGELAGALTIAVERGVLWGVRDPQPATSRLA
jgi:hypothetical protein